LLQLGVIDRIVAEPVGGAHRNPAATAIALGIAIGEELDALAGKTPQALRSMREERFLRIGS
jgi:acetyl-CoA carboxylase carboxyl transferase subunit alpha